jgi:hypothetical protein
LDTRSRTRELQFVDRLLGAVRSLIRHQDAGMDAATFLFERLQLLRTATLRSGPASAGAIEGLASASSASKPTRFEADSMLRKIAQTGIGKIIITRQTDGSGIIEIDGAAVFELSPKLADLLDLLVSSADAKIRSAVGIHHGKKGATSSNHPAVQLVHRLRKAFEKAGLNPFFVDSDRARGVRILVRRRSGSCRVTGPPVA